MSDHVIEDVIERSVRLLDAMEGELDRRSIYWNLYQFLEEFDTGFTNFRVVDLLVKHRYTYAFKPEQHPDFERLAAFFAGLTEPTLVLENPDARHDESTNPVAGYFRDGTLYCDVGSSLWHRFVEQGLLTGADAEPPKMLEMIDIARMLFEEAARREQIDLIAGWYPYLEQDLGPMSVTRLKKNPTVARVREIALRSGALEQVDYGVEPRDLLAAEGRRWWYGQD